MKPIVTGALILTALTGLVWYADQADWIDVQGSLFQSGANANLFNATQKIPDQETAREQYRQALTALKNKEYETALGEFRELHDSYPGLEETILLHQAQALSQLPNEMGAQGKLKQIIQRHPDSPLVLRAQYELAQSHYRAGEPEKAETAFKKILRADPDSAYALGSRYFLGMIIRRGLPEAPSAGNSTPGVSADALKLMMNYWRQYLEACNRCVFSGEITRQLEDLAGKKRVTLTPDDHARMATALAEEARDWQAVLTHAETGTPALSWAPKAMAQFHLGQTDAALTTIEAGLPGEHDEKTAQWAVDTALIIPGHNAAATLNTLLARPLKTGKDYVLWQLAIHVPNQAPRYYQQILADNPNSDYAPESSWRLMWPLLQQQQYEAFLNKAHTHLAEYGYAKSSPMVAFWSGKVHERMNDTAQARKAYEALLHDYPDSYYAFRAYGRLKALHGRSLGADPGWTTLPNRTDYPPTGQSLPLGSLIPAPRQWAATLSSGLNRDHEAARLTRAVEELMTIGAADDVLLILEDSFGHEQVPPAMLSWYYQAQGNRPQGLRILRDAISERTRDAFLHKATPQATGSGQPTETELRILYPLVFEDTIQTEAKRHHLDPWLVQSLMREESYFNEFAVSRSDARGLMQLLPATAREVAGWESLPGFNTTDLFQPAVNIRLGTRYLSHLHELFSGASMFSVGAYNGGPNAMRRWVDASTNVQSDPDWFVENIPYDQTRDYIKKVFGSYWNYNRLYGNQYPLSSVLGNAPDSAS
ncbi:MAG: transglycosylase SLT domain-containing protein [Candidatus Melainabacteria bacterium]